MALNLYPNVYASRSVPAGWKPVRGGTLKYPVRNAAVLAALRAMLPGTWQKVIKRALCYKLLAIDDRQVA
jgi:hypothetical protein